MPFIIHTGKLELGEIAKKKKKERKTAIFCLLINPGTFQYLCLLQIVLKEIDPPISTIR